MGRSRRGMNVMGSEDTIGCVCEEEKERDEGMGGARKG